MQLDHGFLENVWLLASIPSSLSEFIEEDLVSLTCSGYLGP